MTEHACAPPSGIAQHRNISSCDRQQRHTASSSRTTDRHLELLPCWSHLLLHRVACHSPLLARLYITQLPSMRPACSPDESSAINRSARAVHLPTQTTSYVQRRTTVNSFSPLSRSKWCVAVPRPRPNQWRFNGSWHAERLSPCSDLLLTSVVFRGVWNKGSYKDICAIPKL